MKNVWVILAIIISAILVIVGIIKNILAILIMIVFCIIIALIRNITVKLAMNVSRNKSLSKKDFVKEKEYYREILKEYTPAELRYIDDFKIDTKREIVATLLSLELKGKVKIKPNQIIIIDNNIEGLKNTEKVVLENIKEGIVKIEDEEKFQLIIQKEAEQDGLAIKKASEKPEKPIKTSTLIIGVLWLFLLLAIMSRSEENETLDIIVMIMMFITAFIVPPYMATSYGMKKRAYKRTEKGEEINGKIEGLKQYLSDYSLISEKEIIDLQIREEYLIYSVIFGLNTTSIVEDISKLIYIKFELGKVFANKEPKHNFDE